MTESLSSNDNQQSTADTINSLNTTIHALSKSIDKLQQQITQQAQQQAKLLSSIETVIEDKINQRFERVHNEIKNIETRYIAIIDQINESWSSKLTRIRNNPPPASSSEPPGSGSTRARKQPCTAATLDDVQCNLFDSPINLPQNSSDSDTQCIRCLTLPNLSTNTIIIQKPNQPMLPQ